MTTIRVPIEVLPHARAFGAPSYASAGAAGVDLFAAISEETRLEPQERTLVPAGIRLALPENVEAQIRPRSGLALKHGVTLLNAPGTIDSDYRGEIKVILVNLGKEPFVVTPGMRMAHMVVAQVTRLLWDETAFPNETLRGEKGFGSTGMT